MIRCYFMRKQLFSLVLIVTSTILVSCTEKQVLEFDYSDTEAFVKGVKQDEITSVLIIPATVEGPNSKEYKVTQVKSLFNANEAKVEEIYFPKSIVRINSEALVGCRTLKKVVIENPGCTIETKAFKNCYNLEEIRFEKGNTQEDGCSYESDSQGVICDEAFDGCTALRRIIFDSPNYEIKSNAFRNCSELVDVIGLDQGSAIEYGAFENCKKIKNKNSFLKTTKTVSYTIEGLRVADLADASYYWGVAIYNSPTYSSFTCNMGDGQPKFYKGGRRVETFDIVVPEGESWRFKDATYRKTSKGEKSYPYIVYKFGDKEKRYQLPEDGRDFLLYGGDVFRVGAYFEWTYHSHAKIDVVFDVVYD